MNRKYINEVNISHLYAAHAGSFAMEQVDSASGYRCKNYGCTSKNTSGLQTKILLSPVLQLNLFTLIIRVLKENYYS